MPSRPHPCSVVLALATALLLFAGCSVPSSRQTAPPGKPARTGAEAADYSASASRARTESHARYAAAVLHEQNEEITLATAEYYKAASLDPSNENLVMEVTGRLLRFQPIDKPGEKSEETRDKVIDLLKKATARPEASGALFARLGLVYSMAGRKDLAIEANKTAIKKMPDTLSGYQYLAQLHLQNGQTAEGLKVLDEAARQPHPDVTFLIDLGETYTAFGRAGSMETVRPRALDALKRAAAQKPTNPVQLQRLADAFAAIGETDRAIEVYNQLLIRLPNLIPVRDRLVELYLRKQDRTNAAVHLRAIIREAPTNPQTHYLLGSLLFEDRKSKEAAESFQKTVLLSPNFEPAYHDLAAAQMNSDQANQAIATLEIARNRFKPNFVCEFYTALAHSRLKDYTNALKFFTSAEIIARASATNRLTHTFYFQLGSAHERVHHFKEAEAAFRKAIDLSPDFAEALNYLGYMWAERDENLAEARTMIERALKLEPKNAAFLDSLGWVLFKLGLPQEALSHILKSIELNDEPDATLYDHLGDIYAALKKSEKAREAWQKSLSIEPNPKVEQKLKAGGASR